MRLINTLPVPAAKDQAYGLVRDAEGSTKSPDSSSASVKATNQSDLVNRKFCCVHPLSERLALLPYLVDIIFLASASSEMLGVDTQGHVAQVHDVQPSGNWTMCQFVGDPMGGLQTSCWASARLDAHVEKSVMGIGTASAAANPDPAVRPLSHMFPELVEVNVATLQIVRFQPTHEILPLVVNYKSPEQILSSDVKGGDAR